MINGTCYFCGPVEVADDMDFEEWCQQHVVSREHLSAVQIEVRIETEVGPGTRLNDQFAKPFADAIFEALTAVRDIAGHRPVETEPYLMCPICDRMMGAHSHVEADRCLVQLGSIRQRRPRAV